MFEWSTVQPFWSFRHISFEMKYTLKRFKQFVKRLTFAGVRRENTSLRVSKWLICSSFFFFFPAKRGRPRTKERIRKKGHPACCRRCTELNEFQEGASFVIDVLKVMKIMLISCKSRLSSSCRYVHQILFVVNWKKVSWSKHEQDIKYCISTQGGASGVADMRVSSTPTTREHWESAGDQSPHTRQVL